MVLPSAKVVFVVGAGVFFLWWLRTRRVATVIAESGERVPAFYGASGHCYRTETDEEVDVGKCIANGVDPEWTQGGTG